MWKINGGAAILKLHASRHWEQRDGGLQNSRRNWPGTKEWTARLTAFGHAVEKTRSLYSIQQPNQLRRRSTDRRFKWLLTPFGSIISNDKLNAPAWRPVSILSIQDSHPSGKMLVSS